MQIMFIAVIFEIRYICFYKAIQPCSSTAFNNCTAPQICTPFNGSFKCNCPSGYTTKSDGSCLGVGFFLLMHFVLIEL